MLNHGNIHDKIFYCIENAKNLEDFGRSLSHVSNDKYLRFCLSQKEDKYGKVARGMLFRLYGIMEGPVFKFKEVDQERRYKLWKKSCDEAWGSDAEVRILVTICISPEIWEEFLKRPDDMKRKYYQKFDIWNIKNISVCEIFKELCSFSEYAKALSLFWRKLESGSVSLPPVRDVFSALKSYYRQNECHDGSNFYIVSIFQWFDKQKLPLPKKAELEFLFFEPGNTPLSLQRGYTGLFQRLAEEPAFFCYYVKVRYSGGFDGQEGKYRDIFNAWLHADFGPNSRYKLPGMGVDRTIGQNTLKQWVIEARQNFANGDQEDIERCDHEIGRVLACYPSGDDEIWPPCEVAAVLEEIGKEASNGMPVSDVLRRSPLESGFSTHIQNRRGLMRFSLENGGIEMRELQSSFKKYAKRTEDDYPRVAEILRSIADNYAFNANHMDIVHEKSDMHQILCF